MGALVGDVLSGPGQSDLAVLLDAVQEIVERRVPSDPRQLCSDVLLERLPGAPRPLLQRGVDVVGEISDE